MKNMDINLFYDKLDMALDWIEEFNTLTAYEEMVTTFKGMLYLELITNRQKIEALERLKAKAKELGLIK